ncbi:aldehyde dehydrogenase family protein [Actinocorallia aurantiaca]|uniref:Acyl-CoA reductase-like NAD-dependent aldehyde dehydrogenase n=1 Tax=Actinocorallia aurantiaca TaxID=46204 RepID=A0ABP6GAF4_9ACTN
MSESLTSVNPSTLEELGSTPVTTLEELDRLVRSADAASRDWRTDRDRRRRMLAACSFVIMDNQQELAELLVREQGKSMSEASGEVWITGRCFAHMARVDWPETEEAVPAPGRSAQIVRKPYGVIGAIVPWNFPVFLLAAKAAPALAAGNTVIAKPAESVSLTVTRFIELLNRVLPEGVIGVVNGDAAVGRGLIEHRLVRKVSFTGSTAVGREIMRTAAASITPVTLELGGNDPAIVLDGADIAVTAAALAASAYFNAGQMCVAPKRAYVPEHLVDAFCDAFAAAMGDMRVGDPTQPGVTMGPLHNSAQLNVVQTLLNKALEDGAKLVKGGERGTDLPGHFLEPTLLRDCTDAMGIVAEEQFGPVFPVVGYRDLEQVLETVNGQEFGLGASVWGETVRATEVAGRVEAGSVWVNQHNALEVELPFGGVKGSGFGREGGFAGVEDFLQTTVLSVKHGTGVAASPMPAETVTGRHDITTSETDLDALRVRLGAWLSERLGTEVRLDGLRRPSHSGMSSVSVLFDASWTEGGERQRAELVARLAPEESAVPVFPGYDLELQYEVMAGVREHTDVPVPRVRWLEPTGEVLGQPFLVMDRLTGSVPADNPPYVFGGWLADLDPAEQRELQDASVDVLAGIHAIGDPASRFPGLAPKAGLRAHFENERRYYEWSCREDGVRIPLLEEAFAWIEANWPEEPSPDVLCWGDSRIGNIMYTGTRPSGVIDWESAALAPREMDLGWFVFFHSMFQDIADVFELPGLAGLFRRDDVVARYEQTSGVKVRDLDFYLTYAALRHGTVMARIHRRRMHFGEAERPEDPNEYVLHHPMLRRLLDGTYPWK